MDTCAVCGTPVDPYDPPATSQYNGEDYNFCCEECQQKFEQDPQLYANKIAA
jgi:YHS domain-containing protein